MKNIAKCTLIVVSSCIAIVFWLCVIGLLKLCKGILNVLFFICFRRHLGAEAIFKRVLDERIKNHTGE